MSRYIFAVMIAVLPLSLAAQDTEKIGDDKPWVLTAGTGIDVAHNSAGDYYYEKFNADVCYSFRNIDIDPECGVYTHYQILSPAGDATKTITVGLPGLGLSFHPTDTIDIDAEYVRSMQLDKAKKKKTGTAEKYNGNDISADIGATFDRIYLIGKFDFSNEKYQYVQSIARSTTTGGLECDYSLMKELLLDLKYSFQKSSYTNVDVKEKNPITHAIGAEADLRLFTGSTISVGGDIGYSHKQKALTDFNLRIKQKLFDHLKLYAQYSYGNYNPVTKSGNAVISRTRSTAQTIDAGMSLYF